MDTKYKPLVKAIVLQAPVSDREAEMWEMNKKARENADKSTEDNPQADGYDALLSKNMYEFKKNLHYAQGLIDEKKESEMMPRSAFWAPITAYRYMSLHGLDGADDFFSVSFSPEKLKEKMGHIDIPTLFVWSGKDEYVDPQHHKCIDKHLEQMKSSVSAECPACEYC